MTVNFYSSQLEIRIRFCPNVVQEMQRFRQKAGMKEAGGLMFSTLMNENTIEVSKITTPIWLDKCFSNRFFINEKRAQKTINQFFREDLHYVGEWHTHSEENPRPSRTDVFTITDIYKKSEHQLHYFLLVILSSNLDFTRSYVALVNQNCIYQCDPINR